MTDSAVDTTKQAIATVLTFGAAFGALVIVGRLCLQRRVVWPLIVLAGGMATCLLEPLFDSLYGLWFPTQGQWHLFTTYGVHEPVWLPAAYLTVYGGLAIWVACSLERSPTRATVWRLYGTLVGIAVVAEIGYIKWLGAYNYQGPQPFKVLGYPLFLAFANSMSALISGMVLARLVPRLKGLDQLALFMIPPLAFAVDAFGSGFVYLALRHSENPPYVLLQLGALTVALGGALTVRLLASTLLPAEPPIRVRPPASTPAHS
jgi:hypothetical protein